MKRSRGRKAALISSAVALTLLLLVGLASRFFLTRYYLYQLSADPPLLLEKLDTTAGTPEGDAARQFVRTEIGRALFFDEYRRVVLEPTVTADLRNSVLEGLAWIGDGFVSYFQWGRKFVGRYGVDTEATRLRQVANFLPAVEGETFRLEEYPDLSFTIARARAALKSLSPPFRREVSNAPPEKRITCVVRRDEDAALPILLALLADSFVTNRLDAAKRLARLGARAKAAIPALEAVTREELIELFPQVREAALEALETIRSKG